MSAAPAAEPGASLVDPDAHPDAAPGPPQTGDPSVDAALAELEAAATAPVAAQIEAYVGAHQVLQDRLADSDG